MFLTLTYLCGNGFGFYANARECVSWFICSYRRVYRVYVLVRSVSHSMCDITKFMLHACKSVYVCIGQDIPANFDDCVLARGCSYRQRAN